MKPGLESLERAFGDSGGCGWVWWDEEGIRGMRLGWRR